MLSKKEIRKWLLKHCIDEYGNLDLSGLDFSDFNGNVIIAEMNVKKDLVSNYQNVGGSLFQGHQKVGEYLTQSCQKVKGDIFQKSQSAHKVFQDENSHSILDNEEKKYLEAVLRPFKDRIDTVGKREYGNYYFVGFSLCPVGRTTLPWFSKTEKMYQGMELNRDYTLEELGLFKNN